MLRVRFWGLGVFDFVGFSRLREPVPEPTQELHL